MSQNRIWTCCEKMRRSDLPAGRTESRILQTEERFDEIPRNNYGWGAEYRIPVHFNRGGKEEFGCRYYTVMYSTIYNQLFPYTGDSRQMTVDRYCRNMSLLL